MKRRKAPFYRLYKTLRFCVTVISELYWLTVYSRLTGRALWYACSGGLRGAGASCRWLGEARRLLNARRRLQRQRRCLASDLRWRSLGRSYRQLYIILRKHRYMRSFNSPNHGSNIRHLKHRYTRTIRNQRRRGLKS